QLRLRRFGAFEHASGSGGQIPNILEKPGRRLALIGVSDVAKQTLAKDAETVLHRARARIVQAKARAIRRHVHKTSDGSRQAKCGVRVRYALTLENTRNLILLHGRRTGRWCGRLIPW